MDHDEYLSTPEAYNAWSVTRVIEATAPAGETAAESRARCGAVIAMFKSFDPGNAEETMIACHCIELRFMSQAAIRDANNPDLDPKALKGMRASAISISRALHLWLTKLETVRKRNEKRAAEAAPQQPKPPAQVAQSVAARGGSGRTWRAEPSPEMPSPAAFSRPEFAADQMRQPRVHDANQEEDVESLVPG